MIQFHCITVSTKWWHQALWYYSSSFCNYNSQMIECFIPLKAAQNHHCSHRHTSVSRQQQALNRTFIVSKLLLWKAVLIVTLEADTNATTMLVMCQSKGGHFNQTMWPCLRLHWTRLLEYYKLLLELQSGFKWGLFNHFNLAGNLQTGVICYY